MFAPFHRLGGWVAALILSVAVTAEADPSAAERARFTQAWEAARHGPEPNWRKLAAGLEHYPLYPYLELAALQRRIHELERTEVEQFLARFPDTLPARRLREQFLLELARRRSWKDFLDLYRGDEQVTELACAALSARLALGHTLDFSRDLEPMWSSGKPLPGACDAALGWARQQGELTPRRIWQRLEAASRAGRADLVEALVDWLEGPDRVAAERLATALRDPAASIAHAADWSDTPEAREAAVTALVRLARRDSDAALAGWNALATRFAWEPAERARILRTIAVQRAASGAPDALARLTELPDADDDDTSREWRVRAALAVRDWAAALHGLDRLLPRQQEEAHWKYLRARTLVQLRRRDEATTLLATVAQQANFYGFLAADWLGQPYAICARELTLDPADIAAVSQQADLARAFEFFALGDLPEARQEWDFALAKLTPAARLAAAARAAQLGWYDRAIYALTAGEDVRLYGLRFPLAERETIERAAREAGIDPAWVYAIIRAESAFTTDAHSTADAYGLMQLLPGTARQLAKAEGFAFPGPAALFDPVSNIRLGTRYLATLATHFDGSPWLATAAYNAGEEPLGRWLAARDALEPDFFIETIPYKETREYVARVLAFSVIYDWRLHGTVVPLATRLPRIGQAYAEPSQDAPRKLVSCPASPAATATPLAGQRGSAPSY
jgi:soluble lytic murein transglycosylase